MVEMNLRQKPQIGVQLQTLPREETPIAATRSTVVVHCEVEQFSRLLRCSQLESNSRKRNPTLSALTVQQLCQHVAMLASKLPV